MIEKLTLRWKLTQYWISLKIISRLHRACPDPYSIVRLPQEILVFSYQYWVNPGFDADARLSESD